MNYTLTNIDPEFWKQIKIMCLHRGYSVKALILNLLKHDLKRWKREQKQIKGGE